MAKSLWQRGKKANEPPPELEETVSEEAPAVEPASEDASVSE